MAVVIGGTFAIGWTPALVDALAARGIRAAGAPEYDDPFALLIHRAKALRDGVKVVCATQQDIAPRHPQVEALLRELAATLLPALPERVKIVMDADPHEYFAKCVADGMPGTFHELIAAEHAPGYLPGAVSKRLRTPPHVADTPGVLREYVAAM